MPVDYRRTGGGCQPSAERRVQKPEPTQIEPKTRTGYDMVCFLDDRLSGVLKMDTHAVTVYFGFHETVPG
jgi:hypothetical protein